MIDNTFNQVVCALITLFAVFMSIKDVNIVSNPNAEMRPGYTILALVWVGVAALGVVVALGIL